MMVLLNSVQLHITGILPCFDCDYYYLVFKFKKVDIGQCKWKDRANHREAARHFSF